MELLSQMVFLSVTHLRSNWTFCQVSKSICSNLYKSEVHYSVTAQKLVISSKHMMNIKSLYNQKDGMDSDNVSMTSTEYVPKRLLFTTKLNFVLLVQAKRILLGFLEHPTSYCRFLKLWVFCLQRLLKIKT
jgi:hypothetical protein